MVFVFLCRVCRGSTSHVECTRVVFIMADAWRHGPAHHLGSARHCSLVGGRGPGWVSTRSGCGTHCSQVEGQVLGGRCLEGCLHHVLSVMVLDMGQSFCLILNIQKLAFALCNNIFCSIIQIMFHLPFKATTALWLGLH